MSSRFARAFLLSFLLTPAACALLARIAAGRICVLGSRKLATKPKRSGRRTPGAARRETERRFPVMGLNGAAGALMLREMALRLTRPIVAVTSRAAEAEALAAEAAFFLDESADADAATRRVHLLPAWELKPMAQLSPPTDTQASQIAALFAMIRHESPLIVTSAEALMTRTIPRAIFNESIVTVAIGERLDLDALVEALSACGYQRRAADRRAGRLQRARRNRRCILAALSRADSHRARRRYDDLDSAFRRGQPALRRELVEATIMRTRYVPPSALKDAKLRERVALRAAEIGMVRKEAAELAETLENGLLFPGAELLMPYAYGARARKRLRLHAAERGPVDGRSGARSAPRRIASPTRSPTRRRVAARKPSILSCAGIAVSRGRGVRARARGFHRGRGRLAGHVARAARRMGGCRSKSSRRPRCGSARIN